MLNDGDKAVIIGEEGNGKSTLLQWIYDPDLIAGYADASGIRILGEAKTAFLPQELEQEDRTKTVYEFFSEEEAFLLQTPGDLGRMAKDFGTEPDFYYLDQRMETLSGGEKIKAQLMRILMRKPDIPDREEAIGFRMDTGERIPEGKTVLDYSADELRSPDGEKILSRNVRLFVLGPEKICIIGKNGAGKTTKVFIPKLLDDYIFLNINEGFAFHEDSVFREGSAFHEDFASDEKSCFAVSQVI